MIRSETVVWLVASLLVAATLGCGSGEPPTYQVSGKVSYAGQPLPSGSIQFEPDKPGGNSGTCATATIENGTYTTTVGGITGGKYLVRVNPPAIESGADLSKVIRFPVYETKVDLPKGNSTHDFDVPKKR